MARQNLSQTAESLLKKVHFDKSECECLLMHYRNCCEKKMDRPRFRMVLHNSFNITDDMIMDRVFKAFDCDNDGMISQEEWVRGMSIFLRGSPDERMKFCFEVYDMNGDNFITREEMFHLLKASMVKVNNDDDPDEGIKELVDIVVKKMDHDCDNRLSLEDYRQAVEKEPLLMEVFGCCMPDKKCGDAFMAVLTGRVPVQHGHQSPPQGHHDLQQVERQVQYLGHHN